jgi:S1-C subfamily serine protease
MKNIFLYIVIVILLIFDNLPLSNNQLKSAISDGFVSLPGGAGSVIRSRFNRKSGLFDNYILTANHLIDPKKPLEILFHKFDAKGLCKNTCAVKGEIVERNINLDYVIIKATSHDFQKSSCVNANGLYRLMDHVYSIGRPAGASLWITSGEIASLNLPNTNMFGSNAECFFGNSGGGIFNSAGEQIGFCHALWYMPTPLIDLPITHMSFCIRLDCIKKQLGRKKFNYYFASRR